MFAFLSYYYRAQAKYRIHSPHIYKFVMDVIERQIEIPTSVASIEKLRGGYIKNESLIKITDLGAGSSADHSIHRSISSIARSAVSNKRKCELLFRIAYHFQANQILELGTSLGIATSYLAHVAPVTTIEGCPKISSIGQQTLKKSNLHANCLIGEIEDHLRSLIKEPRRFDLIFADGNHQKDPTLLYFDLVNQLLPSTGGVIVFDDIYWSKGMTEAWNIIKQDARVTKSIDLFEMGLVYVGHQFSYKEHHSLIRAIHKPWQTGIFKSA